MPKSHLQNQLLPFTEYLYPKTGAYSPASFLTGVCLIHLKQSLMIGIPQSSEATSSGVSPSLLLD